MLSKWAQETSEKQHGIKLQVDQPENKRAANLCAQENVQRNQKSTVAGDAEKAAVWISVLLDQ